MGILIDYGRQRLELEVSPGQRIASIRGPAALPDPGAVVRAELGPPADQPLLPVDSLTQGA